MKSNLIFFALGCIFVASVAATPVVQNLITVKPAMPSSVIVKRGLSPDGVSEFITSNTKNGYIVKSVEAYNSGSELWSDFIVVMEKY